MADKWKDAPLPAQVARGWRGELKGGRKPDKVYDVPMTDEAYEASVALATGIGTPEDAEVLKLWAFGHYLRAGDKKQHMRVLAAIGQLAP